MTVTDLLVVAGFCINTGITVGLFYGHIRECAVYRQMIKSELDKLYNLVINKFGI